jgi:hypothetical protein
MPARRAWPVSSGHALDELQQPGLACLLDADGPGLFGVLAVVSYLFGILVTWISTATPGAG